MINISTDLESQVFSYDVKTKILLDGNLVKEYISSNGEVANDKSDLENEKVFLENQYNRKNVDTYTINDATNGNQYVIIKTDESGPTWKEEWFTIIDEYGNGIC